MSLIASPLGAPVEAPIVGPLQTFFEAGPSYGYAKTALTLAGVGTGLVDTDGAVVTAATLAATGAEA